MELEYFGNPDAKRKLGNIGTALVSESCRRGGGTSSVSRRNTKDHWR